MRLWKYYTSELQLITIIMKSIGAKTKSLTNCCLFYMYKCKPYNFISIIIIIRWRCIVIELKGEISSRTRKVKFLGVWIDEGLSWKNYTEAVRLKCFSGLAKLRRLGNVLLIGTKKNIYQALVLPHLNYIQSSE